MRKVLELPLCTVNFDLALDELCYKRFLASPSVKARAGPFNFWIILAENAMFR